MWLFVFFFFSSRRRHTRSLCDWSSDVCSSDLRYFSAFGSDEYGQPYSSLPNALKYRTEFNPTCSCKRPGQSWADALGKDEAVEPGDVVVTEERAKQMAVPPPAQKGQTKGKQPAASQPAATPAPTAAE